MAASTLARTGAAGTVHGMRRLSPPRPRHRKRLGTAMLEFALILPIFMFMMVFVLDMGHLVLMSGAIQDATFSAARTGAQLGGGGVDGSSGGAIVCTNGAACQSGSTWQTLNQTAQQIPGYGSLGELKRMTVVKGARCAATGSDTHVVVRSEYSTELLTPGLGGLLSLFSGKSNNLDGDWTLTATAVARCEIVRS
jgi:Flp pilus assembly protein TadG